MTGALHVTLASRLDEIERLAGVVETFVATHGLPEEFAYAFNLSLDEVLTNVISYAYGDSQEHAIRVRLALEEGVMVAEVTDDGRPFNPLEFPPPDLDLPIEERRIGGLGLHLVRQMMDDLLYKRDENRNVLTLRKRAG